MKSKSDSALSSFFDFLKKGNTLKIGIIFALGIILIAFGSFWGADSDGDTDLPDEEERLSALCEAIEGVGECNVMLSYSPSGRVESAAIICEGADSVYVREKLTELITSLYGIGTNRISIQKLGKR